jgi:hypothetical protein
MIGRRLILNATVAVAGAFVLLLSAIALPDAPVDVFSVMKAFGEMEAQALGTHNSLVAKMQRGAINEADFANTIKSDVLPPWSKTRKELEAIRDSPMADKKRLALLIKYMRLREESWHMQVEAIAEEDRSKFYQAQAKWKEADDLVKNAADP